MVKKRILIIEDDTMAQYLLKKRLSHGGYRCIGVSSAEKALEILEKTDPDLVILDLGLQRADGTAFLSHAKDWLPPGRKVPPILVMSGHDHQDIVDYCFEHGAKAFIRKPLKPENLLSLVERSLA
ncbi:MAG: response regulator [Deltaproteobacteria bacterium]|nr:response regulator [Deltaproteobacteria bacterium]